jgi:hypothetical protein
MGRTYSIVGGGFIWLLERFRFYLWSISFAAIVAATTIIKKNKRIGCFCEPKSKSFAIHERLGN